ncbi:MAG: hypothetical protein HY432_03420, partial [Candidatus Liptonbacteria bacterium]|nr:hypothetical protein [Candidatus Liptonbacteria bacterium]
MFNTKKVCIFVDGENLRHSIEDLFPYPSFDKRDYLPKRADWTKFFDSIASEAIESDSERIRTYWYAIQSIDFFPYALNAVRKENNVE